MDAQTPTRRVQRDRSESSEQSEQGAKQIVISMTRQEHDAIWTNPILVRARLETLLQESPELFPPAMAEGFVLYGLLRESAKLPGVRLRKLKLNNGRLDLHPASQLHHALHDGAPSMIWRPLCCCCRWMFPAGH